MSTMKLSEAIREGAKLHPQIFGSYRKFDRDMCEVVGTCALGAVLVATGVDVDDLKAAYPVLNTSGPRCPQCRTKGDGWTVHGLVTHLNDLHEWTRERIADWVDTLEPSTPEAFDLPSPSSASTENATAVNPE